MRCLFLMKRETHLQALRDTMRHGGDLFGVWLREGVPRGRFKHLQPMGKMLRRDAGQAFGRSAPRFRAWP